VIPKKGPPALRLLSNGKSLREVSRDRGKADLKAKLLEFRQSEPTESRPGSFELLGFTHFWGRSRRGKREVRRKTASKRFTRAVQRVREYCTIYRHLSIPEQHEGLLRKLLGHYAYFGVYGNEARLVTFRCEAFRAWQKWLDRRSHNGRMTWPRFNSMLRTRCRSHGSPPRQPESQHTHDLRSRMPELGTSGSEGAPGGRSPGATRHSAFVP